MLLGTSLTTDDDFTGRPESVRAEEIADAAFSRNQLGDGFSRRGRRRPRVGGREAAGFRRAVSRRLDAIPPADALEDIRHDQSLVSKDGRTALIQLDLGPASDDYVERLVETVGSLDEQSPRRLAWLSDVGLDGHSATEKT